MQKITEQSSKYRMILYNDNTKDYKAQMKKELQNSTKNDKIFT